MAPLLAALHPEVTWTANAPREFFRFGGTYQGISGVREYIALHASRYHLSRFHPKSITAEGDDVWGTFDVESLHIPSGKYTRYDCALHWKMRDGKIILHQSFFDTAGVLLQLGELTAA
jgi:ketosteroid isomerase-like protein